MDVGKNINELRKNKRLSQEQLAEMLNVSRQTVSNWELGETSINHEQLIMLSKIFNVSVDELIGNDINGIDEKIKNTEFLVKKQLKFTKIIFITVYFFVLLFFVFLIIYYSSKKDFTKPYQSEFICVINGEERQIYLEDLDGKYILWDNDEEYYAGNSLADVFKSLETIKNVYISQGAKCR